MNTSIVSGLRTTRRGATAPAPDPLILPVSVRRLGFWTAIATATTWLLFFASSSFVLGVFLRVPWDQIITIGASILIAPSFVLLMVSIHY